MPELLTWWSVGLTPAQSWIPEARRSRDLLVGITAAGLGHGPAPHRPPERSRL